MCSVNSRKTSAQKQIFFETFDLCGRKDEAEGIKKSAKMFTCINCTKMVDRDEEDEDVARGSTTPNTKEAVKSLTTQVSLPI
ncbi:hypothetical protein YC2023_055388 [Brassica napus]